MDKRQMTLINSYTESLYYNGNSKEVIRAMLFDFIDEFINPPAESRAVGTHEGKGEHCAHHEAMAVTNGYVCKLCGTYLAPV